MVKRVIIVHGWGGKPDAGWLAWINKELSSGGFEFYALNMPNPETPKIEAWVSFLEKNIKNPDIDTFFIGHSIGCQTILRYLEKLPKNTKIGGAIFVAGWFKLKNLESEEEKIISEPWLNTPINFNNIKPKIGKTVALFSDDDPYVDLENSEIFRDKLGSKIIIENKKGHYIENETKTIPIVLKEILEIIT